MPYNPSTGVFTRPANSFSNPVIGTIIDPDDADTLFDDYDTAFNLVSARSGVIAAPVVGGTASAITLTTGFGLTSLVDGQEFIFTPTGTVAAVLPTIAVDSVAAKDVKSVDGYSFSVFYNIQQGKPLRVRYRASLDVFTILSPPLQFEDAIFGHGRVKLQSNGVATIALTQEDGQGLLVWNSATSSFRMVRMDTIVVSNLFAGNSTIVNGVAGQNLASNKLYSVYVHNNDPTNQNANDLEFWETYSGVGADAWHPVGNEIGIYVKRSTAGGAGIDNTRTYVGIIYTPGGSIETIIGPAAAMGSRVYPHFPQNRWKFGYQTTVVTNVIASASLTTQTTPAIDAATEAISDSPRFDAQAQVTCDTAGAEVSFRISIDGVSFNGTTFTATSPTSKATAPSAGAIVHVKASWESAPPMGWYRARTDIAVSVGSASFATDILGHISQ